MQGRGAAAVCKDWVDDVDDQRLAAGLHFGAVVHKRRNAPVGDALVVMSLDQFAEITNRLRVAEAPSEGGSTPGAEP